MSSGHLIMDERGKRLTGSSRSSFEEPSPMKTCSCETFVDMIRCREKVQNKSHHLTSSFVFAK